MTEYKVRFLPHDRSITVRSGETVIRAALEAGVHINASCGGEGVCGKCRILIEAGRVDGGVTEMLRPADRGQSYRLACKAVICEDVVIRIPVESEVDASVLKRPVAARRTAPMYEPPLPTPERASPFSHPVEKIYLGLSPPAAGDNMPDTSRLVKALRQQHNERRLSMDLDLMRELPDILRQGDFKVTATLLRPVQAGRKSLIIALDPGGTSARHAAFAVDIGTTTVQARLIDLVTDRVIAEEADFNAQISYGEDVITRIMTAEKGDGLERPQERVVHTINGLIEKLLQKRRCSGKMGR